MSGERRTGTVESYDDHAGLGWVVTDAGERHWFHCTQIADGSRHLDAGQRVHFSVVAGLLGRWEAAGLQPV